jgi:hypothetical protein
LPTTLGEHELFVGKHGIRRLQIAACGEPGFYYCPTDWFKPVTNVTSRKEEYHRLFVISFIATPSRQAQAGRRGRSVRQAGNRSNDAIFTTAKTSRMVNQRPPDTPSIIARVSGIHIAEGTSRLPER